MPNTSTASPPPASLTKLLRDFNTPWKMKLYFLQKLPSCIFWGIRVKEVDLDKGVIDIPFGWRTQNPFRSIYFAALCGAAELSSGLLAAAALRGQPPVSMLVTDIEARFVKKANTMTTFTCSDGQALRDTVQRAIESGEGQQLKVYSTGRNTSGEVVCEVALTWSFKRK